MKKSTIGEHFHIAYIDFPAVYAEVFGGIEAARSFYAEIEALPPEKNAAKVVFHQTARMVWLADQINEVARGRPAFQILFYLIAAELVAKITFNFRGERESKKYVRKFFAELCSDDTRTTLGRSFSKMKSGPLSWLEAVDLLYKIRCDVVHEGNYASFHLPITGDEFEQLTTVGNESFIVSVTVQDLRRMTLEGAVFASKNLLNAASSNP
jgi:hypothetical protein